MRQTKIKEVKKMKRKIKKYVTILIITVVANGMIGCKHNVKSERHIHTEDTGMITAEPTCVRKGERTYKCSVCDEVLRIENIEELGLCETPIDAETYKPATSLSKYVYFGVFPRTIKESSVTIDESSYKQMGANIYYKGNDEEYYAKIIAKPESSRPVYSDGRYIYETLEYFKVEPIKWKILTNDYNEKKNSLLLAEEMLTGNIPYFNYTSLKGYRIVDDDKIVDHNNYEYSQIRAYLNGLDYYYDTIDNETKKNSEYKEIGFLQTAFTQAAQDLIVKTIVDNGEYSTTDTEENITKSSYYACYDTLDKIFLLSVKEVTAEKFGFGAYNCSDVESGRIREITDYAKANYASYYGWLLRSPDTLVHDTRIAWYGGSIDHDTVQSRRYGIVPALTISLGQ